jgi:hypothetical protein
MKKDIRKWVILERVAVENKITAQSLKLGRRDRLDFWSIGGILNRFWVWKFWGNFSRRGTHVNIPDLGSRGARNCFGGILGVHADLRRESFWRNLNLTIFWGLGGEPRGVIEEGGTLCVFGELFVSIGVAWGGRPISCRSLCALYVGCRWLLV